MNRRIPAYPLITIDPFCSIWSRDEILNKEDTMLWNGIPKSLLGFIKIDGEVKRFLGLDSYAIETYMWQSWNDTKPLVSTFCLENGTVKVIVKFWSPFIPDDIHMLSLPVGFIDYEICSTDGKDHNIELHFMVNENFCSNKAKERIFESKGSYAFMYNKNQKPLSYSGDGVEADWGKYYLFGDKVDVKSDSYFRLDSIHEGVVTPKKSLLFFDVFAYDDIYSIEYMGKKLKSVWTEKFNNIVKVGEYCRKNHNAIYNKIIKLENKILDDAKCFGEDYETLISAVYRHVMAGHKLVRDKKGNLLYFSKECFSNGCINTVDVTFPSTPLYFMYAPKLIPAFMNGIFEFASMPVWKYDFAPHDLGIYPLDDGQVYGSYCIPKEEHKTIYKRSTKIKSYLDDDQMPVENSGNMIIMTYAYYLLTGDLAYVKKHFDTEKKWADYLVKFGDSKELQLSTDDFAGRFKGNINLAIKASVALFAFGKICELVKEDGTSYFSEAKAKAKMIVKDGTEDGHLKLAFDSDGTWSLKYNMVWDKIFGFGLFPKKVYKNEIDFYLKNETPYGFRLNSLRNFTKSDWEMWVAAFDEKGDLTKHLSASLMRFCEHTRYRVPFTDFYDAVTGEWTMMMAHRTVQGGLWMPVLAKNFSSKRIK